MRSWRRTRTTNRCNSGSHPTKSYRELLAVVYKRLAEKWRVSVSWEECLAYGRSIEDWPAFPDSAVSLQYLKRHYKLIILSNVDNAELRR